MKKLTWAALILAGTSISAPAAIIGSDLDTQSRSEIQSGFSIENTPDLSQQEEDAYQQLSTDQRYTLMLASMQNGNLGPAIYMAKDLSRVMSLDVHVKALLIAGDIRNGNLDGLEVKLKALQPEDKYQSASIELISALYHFQKEQHETALGHIQKVYDHLPAHPYAGVLEGNILVALGRNDEAKKAYLSAIARYDGMGGAYVNLGLLESYIGDQNKALQYFDKALALRATNCTARIGKARIQYSRNLTENAWLTLESCTEKTQNIDSRVLGAELLSEMGRQKQAWALLSQTKNFKSNTDLHNLAAHIALRNGDFQNAITYSGSDDAQARYLHGIAQLAKGNLEGSILTLDRLIDSRPKATSAILARSIAKSVKGDRVSDSDLAMISQASDLAPFAKMITAIQEDSSNPEKVSKSFRQASGIARGLDFSNLDSQILLNQVNHPNSARLSTGLLFILLEMDDAARAELMNLADGEDFLGRYLLASLEQKAGKWKEAEGHLEASAKQAPAFFPSRFLLGEVLLKQGKLARAEEEYQAAIGIRPDPFVLLKAGALAEHQNKDDQAERYYQQLTEVAPDNYIAYNQLAWFYASRNKKLDEGLKLAQQAYKLQANDPNVLDTLGWIHYLKSEYQPAMKFLTQANAMTQNGNPEFLFHLAHAQYKSGSRDLALSNVEKALKRAEKTALGPKLKELEQQIRSGQ